MSNDTSTLSGALLEMKDQLIYELGQKGVTASYDSSTGLLGLIGRISDIQTGGSCYHIEFSEDSYTAVGGSATLEIYLQENYAPKSGATVTVTGSDSSLYTGITNSSGIASVTVNNISSQTTFTATYSNVSTQCTVTVSSYIFYDEGSASGVSNYGTIPHREGSADPTYTISYDSTENAYLFQGECCISQLTGITDDFRLEVDMKRTVNSEWCSLEFVQNTGNGFFYGGSGGRWQGHYYQNNSWRGSISGGGTSSVDTWYHLELVKNGTSITINCYDSTGTTLLKSASRTYANSDNYYGILLTGYFKNVKAEYI